MRLEAWSTPSPGPAVTTHRKLPTSPQLARARLNADPYLLMEVPGIPYRRVFDIAVNHRQVMPPDRPRLHLAHQLGLRLDGLRHHHQSTRVLVESMHDPGPGYRRQSRGVMKQGIEQRAAPVSASRMHHQPNRLVDDEKYIILVDDLQRNIFGLIRRLLRQQWLQHPQRFTTADAMLGVSLPSVHGDQACLEPVLQAATRMRRKQPGKRLVQTQAREIMRNPQFVP